MSEPRHSRQARLAEVGEEGQRRLHAGTARLAGVGVPALLAARYVAGAGFGRVEITDPRALSAAREVDARVVVAIHPRLTSSAPPEWIAALEEGPRAVASGAHEALREIRRALDEGS